VLVSPWLAKGQIEKRRLQHTSVLATVRKMWGLRAQPLTAREGQAATFDDLLESLAEPRRDCPSILERPQLPDVSLAAALDQPLSPVQREIFEQVTQLDGHIDSGHPAPVPRTQGEAAKVIRERMAAHKAFHEKKATPAQPTDQPVSGPSSGKFSVYRDKRGEVRWRLLDTQGAVIASSGEGFKTLDEAKKDIDLVKTLAGAAVLDLSAADAPDGA
jgi:uncharacterized protein YegP (UPF0339 family)